MKAAQVRSQFLEFFAARGHKPVASSSLVPSNDPTLLFTNAGMVQFKDIFTGGETRDYKRATTSQKCVRAGGKHNDLDEVGKTPRHHTFFEMLGNFSFGDYFKEDAVAWAWELLTKVYEIDASRLCITVFGGDSTLGIGPDEEARALWKRVTGFGDDRIIGLGVKDNFWMMGETGPMGPCSEIHYFTGGKPSALPTVDPASWPGWLEIWNLVFMQFERKVAGGPLLPLPAPSIDTGAGLERVSAVLQGVGSNYETDLFTPLTSRAAELARTNVGADPKTDVSLRVIADHARCAAFLIADGVFPDKNEREYVLRRIFRRAVRHGKLLGISDPFMHVVCDTVVDEMKGQFPELAERRRVIAEVALEEEKRFRATLDRGLDLLETEFSQMQTTQRTTVAGDALFRLYDTYGFPVDLTEIIASERGFAIDKPGFEKEMASARERSKFAGSDQEAVGDDIKRIAADVGPTTFTGYEGRGTTGEGTVVALLVGGQRAKAAKAGDAVGVICDKTPFYAESGGQVGDTGMITSPGGARVRVTDTKKPAGDVFVMFGTLDAGTLSVGDAVALTVDETKRDQTRANHSATHLLHLALRRTLGTHVAQKGSLVSPDRLRFDFSHFSPMTADQLRDVEDWVNTQIRRNADSAIDVLAIEEAKARGAVAMFGEKYGATVRVVRIGDESLEFCGGTHVRRAGDVGLFKLLSESGIAQGVRRIEAVTGVGALAYVRALEDELGKVGERLKVNPLEAAARVDKMMLTQRTLEKEIDKLKAKIASGRDLLADLAEVAGIKVLATSTEVDDVKVLRSTGEGLLAKLGSGVVVLAGTGGADVKLLAMVTADLTARVHAGKLLGVVAAAIGGKAGGKADVAQGGGKDAAALPAALDAARSWIATL